MYSDTMMLFPHHTFVAPLMIAVAAASSRSMRLPLSTQHKSLTQISGTSVQTTTFLPLRTYVSNLQNAAAYETLVSTSFTSSNDFVIVAPTGPYASYASQSPTESSNTASANTAPANAANLNARRGPGSGIIGMGLLGVQLGLLYLD
jgi:hypothetical protein